MEKPSKSYKIVASALVAVGLMTSGYFIGTGLKKFRTYPRPTVQVKGISERQVKSDFAIWKIRFKASDKSLESVRTEFAKSRKMLQDFLIAGGFNLTEIVLTKFRGELTLLDSKGDGRAGGFSDNSGSSFNGSSSSTMGALKSPMSSPAKTSDNNFDDLEDDIPF